jgi:hypothetical protein
MLPNSGVTRGTTLEDPNDQVQQVVGWVAAKYEETGLWPNQPWVWRGLRWIGQMLLSGAMLAVPLAALADTDAAERAAQAQAACLSGDPAKGVSILAELYVSTRNPTYIFNQGRCFEQSGKCEEAIVRFREYQRKNANAGLAPDPAAEEHIIECQALIEKQRLAAQVAPSQAAEANAAAPLVPVIPPVEHDTSPPPAQPAAGVLPAAGPVPTDAFANRADLIQTASPASQAQPENSIFSRWWFWTAVGAVVAGGVMTALLLSRGGGGTKVSCTDCADSAEVNLQ